MKKMVMLFYIAFFWKCSAAFCEEIFLSTFDFQKHYPSPCEQSENCFSLNSLIGHALRFSYDSREEIELLFQARKKALEQLGAILPHITITQAAAIKDIGILGAASAFIGFLFPNRWFDWKEKRAQAQAELEAFKTLLANRANAVQTIYFTLQVQIWNMRIYKHYIDQMVKLCAALTEQRTLYGRNITGEDIGVLEVAIAKLRYNNAFQAENLTYTYPLLANAIGLEVLAHKNWFAVEAHDLQTLKDYSVIESDKFVKEARSLSTELKTLDFLIVAAENNKKSNYFDFFDPGSGSGLGLGLGQRIKISRSAKKVLKIQRKSTWSQIGVNIFNQMNNHNDSLNSGKAAERALSFLDGIRVEVEKNIQDHKAPFNVTSAVRYFKNAVGTGLRFSTAYFIFRTAEAALNRATWFGPNYQAVKDYINKDLNNDYREVKKRHRFRHCFTQLFRHEKTIN